jgi:hypothetical protein
MNRGWFFTAIPFSMKNKNFRFLLFVLFFGLFILINSQFVWASSCGWGGALCTPTWYGGASCSAGTNGLSWEAAINRTASDEPPADLAYWVWWCPEPGGPKGYDGPICGESTAGSQVVRERVFLGMPTSSPFDRDFSFSFSTSDFPAEARYGPLGWCGREQVDIKWDDLREDCQIDDDFEQGVVTGRVWSTGESCPTPTPTPTSTSTPTPTPTSTPTPTPTSTSTPTPTPTSTPIPTCPICPSWVNLTDVERGDGKYNKLVEWENVANEDGYRLIRWIATYPINYHITLFGADVTSYTDTNDNAGFSPGTTVKFIVRPSLAGCSEPDCPIDTNVFPTPTSTPTPTPACPICPSWVNLTDVERGDGKYNKLVQWENVANEEGYDIYRCSGAGCSIFPGAYLTTVGADVISYTDTNNGAGFSPGTTIRYEVRPFQESCWALDCSDYTNVFPTPTLGPTATPTPTPTAGPTSTPTSTPTPTPTPTTVPSCPSCPSWVNLDDVPRGDGNYNKFIQWQNVANEESYWIYKCYNAGCTPTYFTSVGVNVTSYTDNNGYGSGFGYSPGSVIVYEIRPRKSGCSPLDCSDHTNVIPTATSTPTPTPTPVPGLPDLMVTDIWYDSWPNPTRISYRIRNSGTEWAGESTSILWIDSINLALDIASSLNPGQQRDEYFNYTFVCSDLGDTIEVCVDVNNVVAESNEANNCRTEYWPCPGEPTPTPTPTITPTPTPEYGSISGRVFDSSQAGTTCLNLDSRPALEGATVTADELGDGEETRTSQSDGSYSFDDISGTFLVSASKDDYAQNLVCEGTNPSGGSLTVPPDHTDVNFGLTTTVEAWFQTEGGDVHANNGVTSEIPQATCDPDPTCQAHFSLALAPTEDFNGLVTSGDGIDMGTGDVGEKKDWSETDESINLSGYNYAYFNALIDQDDGSHDLSIGKPSVGGGVKVYRSSGDQTVSGSWTVNSGEKFVFLIGSKLTIGTDITVDPGGFISFIVNGEIEITDTVTSLQGIYVANTITTSGQTDDPFYGEGMFIGFTAVSLNRTFVTTDLNETKPVETFTYRPDLPMNAPDFFRQPTYTWQEVAP